MAVPGIIETEAGERRRPVGQHAAQAAGGDVVGDQPFGDEGDAVAVQRGFDREAVAADRQHALDVERDFFAVALELPAVDGAARHPLADAIVGEQIGGGAYLAVRGKIGRRGDDAVAEVRPEGHRDHVARHGFAEAEAGVEPFRDNIHHAALGDDVEIHRGIAAEIFGDDPAEHLLAGALGDVEAQRA